MLLQRLRNPVLAATLALLVTPGAALATDDNASSHRDLGVIVIIDYFTPRPTVVLREACLYLEMNMPGYDCTVSLAEYAGQPEVTKVPDGIDYKFWEDNVWELQGSESAEAPAVPLPAPKPPRGRGVPGFF